MSVVFSKKKKKPLSGRSNKQIRQYDHCILSRNHIFICMNRIRKERFRRFFNLFKGGGVLTIVFLFEQLSDNLNQVRLKTRGKS